MFAQLRHEPSYNLRHRVASNDGWPITLYEYSPRQQSSQTEALPPVILCHGAFSRFHIYDWGSGAGLAPHLARQGRRVFAIDLRGRGDSYARAPHRRVGQLLSKGWTIDDLLSHDVPAAVQFVTQLTRASQVDWVGHSMGGMLILAHLNRSADASVRRVVTVGSTAFRFLAAPENAASASSAAKRERRVDLRMLLGPLAQRIPVIPVRPVMRGLALSMGIVPARFRATAYNPRNVSADVERRYLWHGFSNVSAKKFRQFAQAVGEPPLSDYSHPTLFLAGQRDLLIPPSLVEQVHAGVGSSDKRYVLCAKHTGYSADYGHGDLLIGERAPTEIFPLITDFLAEGA